MSDMVLIVTKSEASSIPMTDSPNTLPAHAGSNKSSPSARPRLSKSDDTTHHAAIKYLPLLGSRSQSLVPRKTARLASPGNHPARPVRSSSINNLPSPIKIIDLTGDEKAKTPTRTATMSAGDSDMVDAARNDHSHDQTSAEADKPRQSSKPTQILPQSLKRKQSPSDSIPSTTLRSAQPPAPGTAGGTASAVTAGRKHQHKASRTITPPLGGENSAQTTPLNQSISIRGQKGIISPGHSAASARESTQHSLRAALQFPAVDVELQKQVQACRRSHEALTRNILRTGASVIDQKHVVDAREALYSKESPFRHMKSMAKPITKNDPTPTNHMRVEKVVYSGKIPKEVAKTYVAVPMSFYESVDVTLPLYTAYTRLQTNFLGENEQRLLIWPSFADVDAQTEKRTQTELAKRYQVMIAQRREALDIREHSRHFRKYASRFLAQIGITKDDVFRYLLDPAPDWNLSDASDDVRKALPERAAFCEEISRREARWDTIASSLRRSDPEALALAALACAVYVKHFNYSLWHVVKLSISPAVGGDNSSAFTQQKSFLALTCHVCQAHDCPVHGEIEMDSTDEYDSDNLPFMNKKVRVNKLASPSRHYATQPRAKVHAATAQGPKLIEHMTGSAGKPEACSKDCFTLDVIGQAHADMSVDAGSVDKAKLMQYFGRWKRNPRLPCLLATAMNIPCGLAMRMILQQYPDFQLEEVAVRSVRMPVLRNRPLMHWLDEELSMAWNPPRRRPFYPCSHEGSCETARCQCFLDKVPCEKTCACAIDCDRRYRGCSCAKVGRQVCWQSQRCECFRLRRECDADLCGTCGASEVLDPANRRRPAVRIGRCANVCIQLNIPKRTLMGHSQVSGIGLYAGEVIKEKEFISEYKGETTTTSEADRRDTFPQYRAMNYRFDVNKDQVIDSTRGGDKTRFINHADEDGVKNCFPQIMQCNTVIRIGIYALRDIAAGEELLFDYGKDFWANNKVVHKKTAAAVVPVKVRKQRGPGPGRGRGRGFRGSSSSSLRRGSASTRGRKTAGRGYRGKRHADGASHDASSDESESGTDSSADDGDDEGRQWSQWAAGTLAGGEEDDDDESYRSRSADRANTPLLPKNLRKRKHLSP